jgi:hypothetical protein
MGDASYLVAGRKLAANEPVKQALAQPIPTNPNLAKISEAEMESIAKPEATRHRWL